MIFGSVLNTCKDDAYSVFGGAVIVGTTTTVQLGRLWKKTCWTTQNILSRTLLLLSRLQFGGGWPQSKSHSHHPMMLLLATGSRPRMILWLSVVLVLEPQWTFFTGTIFVGRVMLIPWTTSFPITSITLTFWVLAVRRQGQMRCSLVLSRLHLTLQPLPAARLRELYMMTR